MHFGDLPLEVIRTYDSVQPDCDFCEPGYPHSQSRACPRLQAVAKEKSELVRFCAEMYAQEYVQMK